MLFAYLPDEHVRGSRVYADHDRAAHPIVYRILQKQFISGLTLGANKG